MALPLDDWQFWIASAIALGAIALVAWPWLRRKKSTACRGCPSGAAAARTQRRGTPASITIEGKRVG